MNILYVYFDPNLVMACFDVKSLFTNIPLTETIGLCVDNLYRNQTHTHSLSKSSFRRLLKVLFPNLINVV